MRVILPAMALRHAFVFLAERIQEAGESLSSNEMRTKLSKAVDAAHSGTGKYADYLDHTGDENGGMVRYQSGNGYGSSGSAMKQAPYSKGTGSSDSDYSIDTGKEKKVSPVTTYVEEPDDCDGYAAMEAAKLYSPGPIPLNERFVSKKERDAADSSDFAGKGKSFPILKAEDVGAAMQSLGRAGSDNHSVATIRANIIKIAKRKGYALPASAQSDDTKESAAVPEGSTRLIESMVSFQPLPQEFTFTEGGKPYPLVKIINEGRGSSGYYTKEVLKRDGPKIYKAGTPMYINHATAQEAAARPERNWNDMAAVTMGDAYWDDNGPDGPALYAPSDIFSRFESEVREKAKHTGVSICASGVRDDKAMAPDGKPGLITALTAGDSVDFVTRAGRGGKMLVESALEEKGGQMADTEVQKLREATRLIHIQLAEAPARRLATSVLSDLRLPAASKMAVIERALTHVTVTEAGAFDEAAFKPILEAEINYAASFIQGGVKAVGLGAAQAAAADPKILEAQRLEERERLNASLNRSAGLMGLESETAKRVFREGRAAFDPTYNSRKKAVA